MCLPRFLYDEIPPNSSNLWRENRAAVTIQRSYRDHRHRKRQAAARKIQNFMRQSRINQNNDENDGMVAQNARAKRRRVYDGTGSGNGGWSVVSAGQPSNNNSAQPGRSPCAPFHLSTNPPAHPPPNLVVPPPPPATFADYYRSSNGELLQYDECLSSTGGIPPSAPLSSVHYGNCQSDGYGQQAPTITADGSATARSQCHLAPGGSSAYIQQHKPSVYPPPTNGSLATDPHYPTEQQQHAQW